jgi:hypothetical protein
MKGGKPLGIFGSAAGHGLESRLTSADEAAGALGKKMGSRANGFTYLQSRFQSARCVHIHALQKQPGKPVGPFAKSLLNTE